jgi:Uncharacterised nucleotidyltransferase
VFRREPLSLPYGDQAGALGALVRGARVAPPADPERFGEAVRYHRLSAFAVEAREAGRLELGDDVARTVADEAAYRGLFARGLAAELAKVEPALARACAARPLILKGPAAARLYERRPLRPFGDLDLLVARSDLALAAGALSEHGYSEVVEFGPGFAETHGHDVHLRRTVGRRPIDIELHWRIGDDELGRSLSRERLAEGAQPFTVAGAECLAPGAEPELLALALHLLSDRDKRMIWICDVHRAALALEDDGWAAAFDLAAELDLLWPLHRALDYAHGYLAFRRARPLPAGEAPAWGPLRAVEEVDAKASVHIGRLVAMPGWRARARYAARILVPSRAGLRGNVGRDGAPMWRLVGRHVRAAVAGARSRRR